MSEKPKSIGCAEFQAQLPELIGSGVSAADHPHVKDCALCRELLESLETIARAARELFPEVEPPEDLWDKLELAIKKDESEENGGKHTAGAVTYVDELAPDGRST